MKLSTSPSSSPIPSSKTRKPYTATKQRETWSAEEHQKFVEAIKLYRRDWKQIEKYVGTKTVIQIRSHAQKYFIKLQKMNSADKVPPPRPKKLSPRSSPKLQKTSQTVISNPKIQIQQPLSAIKQPPPISQQTLDKVNQSLSVSTNNVLNPSNQGIRTSDTGKEIKITTPYIRSSRQMSYLPNLQNQPNRITNVENPASLFSNINTNGVMSNVNRFESLAYPPNTSSIVKKIEPSSLTMSNYHPRNYCGSECNQCSPITSSFPCTYSCCVPQTSSQSNPNPHSHYNYIKPITIQSPIKTCPLPSMKLDASPIASKTHVIDTKRNLDLNIPNLEGNNLSLPMSVPNLGSLSASANGIDIRSTYPISTVDQNQSLNLMQNQLENQMQPQQGQIPSNFQYGANYQDVNMKDASQQPQIQQQQFPDISMVNTPIANTNDVLSNIEAVTVPNSNLLSLNNNGNLSIMEMNSSNSSLDQDWMSPNNGLSPEVLSLNSPVLSSDSDFEEVAGVYSNIIDLNNDNEEQKKLQQQTSTNDNNNLGESVSSVMLDSLSQVNKIESEENLFKIEDVDLFNQFTNFQDD